MDKGNEEAAISTQPESEHRGMGRKSYQTIVALADIEQKPSEISDCYGWQSPDFRMAIE